MFLVVNERFMSVCIKYIIYHTFPKIHIIFLEEIHGVIFVHYH